jgi:UDP-N-acetylmuramyl pentapeptide phosphotransferase/UDP-N-acetylglucosamine-1-phosphate transferase
MAHAFIAFLVAAALAGAVRQAGLIDDPNTRSSHAKPTPRGAGLAVLGGFAAALVFLGTDAPALGGAFAAILIAGALATGLGLLDDLVTPGERLKFVLLCAISLYLAAGAGPVDDLSLSSAWALELPWLLALFGSALWVFTLANAVNFMDGSDGLIAAALIPAALALSVLSDGQLAVAALILAGAMAGFAVWNAPFGNARARVFAGDAGSLGAAVLFAGLALYWATTGRPGAVWLAPLLVMPILADVLLTMASRAKAKRPLFTAHRAHAYQLLLRMGMTHGRVALIWGIGGLLCGALAIAASHGPVWAQPAAFLAGVALVAVPHQMIRRRARARGLDVTQ